MVGMVQTVTRRLSSIKPPKLIITDEFHHCLSKTYRNIYEYFDKSLLLGFTATPIRLKEKGLGDICQKLIIGVTASWLIDNNYMSDYDYFNNKLIDTSGLRIIAGDYNKGQIDSLMNDNVVYVGAVENYLKYADGKSAIVYCTNVENSKNTAKEFINNNIPAGFISGSQNKADREQVMEDFKSGKIKILTSCEVISEGIDIADCECCILLRPTQSLSLFIQQSMRCLTYKLDKKAVILDLVGNYNLHGLPTQERSWSLKGVERPINETKECKNCFKVYKRTEKICPYCNYTEVRESNDLDTETQKDEVVAQLGKIDKKVKVINNYWDCTTFEELMICREKITTKSGKKPKFGWLFYKANELNIEIPDKYKTYIKVRDNAIAQKKRNATNE